MQSVMNNAKTFAPVKAASAAIAFYQKINLFDHEPTQSPAVCLVRGAAMRKFGLNPKNRKEPFEWEQVVSFVEAYGVRHQGYCHLVVATMAIVMFGGMCRYDDASGLLWRNVRFEEDGSAFEITFDKRKNAQYRQGNKVLVASSPLSAVCPVRLLRELQIYTGGSEDLHIFRGFNGRLVAKSPRTTAPGPKQITYDQFLRFMSLWFSGVMGVSVAAFRKQFATQSGRSGGASAASNGGVSAELWGQHGDWKTLDAQKRYMKCDKTRLLSVSRAAMRLPTGLAPDVRTECGSAVDPPLVAGDDAPPDVVGVPKGAFSWSG
jgi:integrase